MKDTTAEIVELADLRRDTKRAGASGYEHAGALFMAAREAQGLSLEEAAAKIHIKRLHLTAIEALELELLPARPYVIGFVRAYAEFLGLNVEEAIEFFKESAGYQTAPRIDADRFEQTTSSAPAQKPELSLAAMIGIIAFILWCMWQITLPREVRQLGDAAPSEAPIVVTKIAPAAPAPENLVEAQLVERIEPVYPMACLRAAADVETVSVTFTVSREGRVVGERVSDATNTCFSNAALIAVRRWRFEPRTIDGAARTAHDQTFELTFRRPL